MYVILYIEYYYNSCYLSYFFTPLQSILKKFLGFSALKVYNSSFHCKSISNNIYECTHIYIHIYDVYTYMQVYSNKKQHSVTQIKTDTEINGIYLKNLICKASWRSYLIFENDDRKLWKTGKFYQK